MAAVARTLRVEFGIDKPDVHIRMAIHAAFADIFEFPLFRFLFVAGKTRRSHVRAFQFEFGLVVLGNGVRAIFKTVHGVAPVAIGADAQDGSHLAFVVILVAGIAGEVRQGIEKIAAFMAFLAIQALVFPGQFKTRQVVVEFLQGALPLHPERFFIVAFGAVGSEFIVVHVPVAAGTVAGPGAEPVLKNSGRRDVHGVAAGAVELLVFAF